MKENKSLYNKIESIIMKLCIIGIILILFIQISIKNEDLSVFFSTNSNIIDTQNNDFINTKKGILILKIENQKKHEKVEILVNGELRSDFVNNEEITIEVYNNDVVEINGGMYKDNIRVKVVEKSQYINYPELGEIIQINRNIKLVGKVIIN